MSNLDNMISDASGRRKTKKKPEPVKWWEFPKNDEEQAKWDAEVEAEEAKCIKYIPGVRPQEGENNE